MDFRLGNGTGHPRGVQTLTRTLTRAGFDPKHPGSKHVTGHQTLTRTLTRRHPDPKPVGVPPTRATPYFRLTPNDDEGIVSGP
jgi:hypothetical protein